MRVRGEIKPWRASFDTSEHKLFDRIEGEGSETQRMFDSVSHVSWIEHFHEAQDLNVLPLTLGTGASFEQPSQAIELLRQIPALQRCRLIERTGFLFQ